MDRGTWRIHLGASPGVGTTYAMLEEGRRRAERGARVLIGWVDTHGRPGTAGQLAGLERLPAAATAEGADGTLDVAAVLARRPDVCLVDDLAGGTPVPRWAGVLELLDAGVDVVSTLRIEEVASLRDVVDDVLGPGERSTVPDEVLARADQVELVDMTPEALRRRLAHGNVVGPDELDGPTADRFRPAALGALRQLALLWVAGRAGLDLPTADGPAEVRERVVVALTAAPGSDRTVRRAARLAGRLGGDLVGVHVRTTAGPDDPRLAERRTLLEDLGGRYLEVVGAEVADALLAVARAEGATQLVVGARPGRGRNRGVVRRLVEGAHDLDVHVAAPGTEEPPRPLPRRRPLRAPRLGPLPGRRRAVAWAAAALGPVALTAALVPLRAELDLSTVLLGFLALAVGSAALGGTGPGLLAAAAGFGLGNWWFTEPFHTLSIAEPEHLVALLLGLGVASAVGAYVSSATRQAAEAARARAEAAALARAAASTVAPDPLEALVALVAQEVGAAAVTLREVADDGEAVEVRTAAPAHPSRRRTTLPVGSDAVLEVEADELAADDLRLLGTLAAQLASALRARRLAGAAAEIDALASANELRAAILGAASHDLRTPLAGIKAAVTSLLATDVAWDDASRDDFLRTIDDETDRLTGILTNLLDLSRLEAGAVSVHRAAVGPAEVVASALASLDPRGSAPVRVEVDEALPDLDVDAGLLERAVANLVQNALRHGGGAPVQVLGSVAGDRFLLRVVDRGPGIARGDRRRVFEAFERAGQEGGPGVGLGLAVSRGFVEANDGTLEVEDTPGGGCTMVLSLPLPPRG